MSSQTTTTGRLGGPGAGGAGPVRTGTDAVRRVLAIALMPVLAAQFALAGLGAFGVAYPNSIGYGPHEMLGTVIGAWSVLLLIAALIARPGRRALVLSIVLFVLAAPVQPLLAGLGRDTSAWFGALHALSGIAIVAVAGMLSADARRNRLTTR